MLSIELLNLIGAGKYQSLKTALMNDPSLANAGIPCSDDQPEKKGHPLHRICDAVFAGIITDDQAIEIAKILLEFGADIDGYKLQGDNNTPLIAAASLHAEKLGIFYIQHGADVFYADNDGATALHWASFCGREQLVAALIAAGANIDQEDIAFNSTPVGWAVHTLTSDDRNNQRNQLACVKLLFKAGANKNSLDAYTLQFLQETAKTDEELDSLLQ